MEQARPRSRGFRIDETHGILRRPEHSIRLNSEKLGWNSLFASLQHELPYEGEYAAVEDHLVILHLNGPVGVERRLGGRHERRLVPAGGLFIMPGGTGFGVRLEAELDTLHIYLRHAVVSRVAQELGTPGGRVEISPSLGVPDLPMEGLAHGLRDALLCSPPGDSVYADYLCNALAARLLRPYSASRQTAASAADLGPPQLRRLIDMLEAKLDHSLGLPEMAAACDMSVSHFARCFKLATGTSPHQYVMRMRIERAKRLLRGSAPIAEIALDCGFAHQEHLTSVFRRFMGMTPAVYRRSSQ